MEKKIDNKIPTLIRIDEKLYEDIRYYSSIYNRSINKQIEFILKEFVEEEDKKRQNNEKSNDKKN